MPANLTPDYQKAEQQYREAKTPGEKLDALELMLATIPKHKGTEKLQADLKRRIAKMRTEPAVKKARAHDPYRIERSGAGQVVLIGLPNAGKSAVAEALTQAPVVVAEYPFATHAPTPGMAAYEDVHLQLIDMPPYTEQGYPPGMAGAIRGADVVAVVLDGSVVGLLDAVELGLRLLVERKMIPAGTAAQTVPAGEDPVAYLEKPVLFVVTKLDRSPDGEATVRTLRELYPHLEFLGVSGATGENLDRLTRRLFELLDVVRVYAKPPGKPPDMHQPFVFRRGSTVLDFTAAVHRGLLDHLKFARVWGEGKYPGQQVPRDYVLQDRDTLELHT